METTDTFETACIGKMELTIKQHEATINHLQYESAQMHLLTENAKNDKKETVLRNINLTRANKKLNERISSLLKELETIKKNTNSTEKRSIGTQTGNKNNTSIGTYVPREDETFLFHEEKTFSFGSHILEKNDVFARITKFIEGQYLLINYVFVGITGQKFDFGVLLRKKVAPSLRIKIKFLTNALCRQRRACIPVDVNILEFKNFKTNLAIKLVHEDEHPIINEASEWALRIHKPNPAINFLVKRTLNKLDIPPEYDFLMKLEHYQRHH